MQNKQGEDAVGEDCLDAGCEGGAGGRAGVGALSRTLPFLCRIGIRMPGDMAGLRPKAPTSDERQHCKDHHEHEHRARRRSRRDKAAQCGADDNAHVGEHGDGGVDVFELDRIVSEVGWIGCGDGLGESHHKAQEHRAEQDDAGRAAKNEDRRAGCQRAHDAQQEMTARAPGFKRRATRKGSQESRIRS